MISLEKLLTEVAELCMDGDKNLDSNVKTLRRRFKAFIERGGGSIEKLRGANGRNIYFEEEETPFIKAILIQLAEKQGFAHKFLKTDASLDEEHDFLQEILDLMADEGWTDAEMEANLVVMDRLFQLEFRKSLVYCHNIIDAIAVNLMQYPYTHQMRLMLRFKGFLKRAFFRTFVESVRYDTELLELIRDMKEVAEVDDVDALYGEEDDDVKAEYRQRDASLIMYLRNNPDVKKVVESYVGETVEEIFGLQTDEERGEEDT